LSSRTKKFIIRKNSKIQWASLFIFTSILLFIPGLSPISGLQKVSTEVDIHDGIFVTESGLLPLPENAVELEKDFSLPPGYFRSAQKITHDRSGNIYVRDLYKSAVFKFSPAGEFISQIGEKGKRKGKLLKPNCVFTTHNALYIQDWEKETIECLDLDGNYQKSLKISQLDDFVLDQNGVLYVAPIAEDEDTPLVKVYSLEKESLRSFGKPVSFRHSMDVLNSRTLTINGKGELWVAFTYFPIVRKYSKEGELISEFKIKNLIMEAKEQHNLKKIGRGIARSSQRVGYMEVIMDIKAYGDKIYLLSHYPRLEITELHENGTLGRTYWKEFQEIYKTCGFIIQEAEGKPRFVVLRSNPPNDSVDVLKEMEEAELSPLERDLKKYNETIQINPDYWRAYHARALVKYQYRDFKGAVEDLTKVIELNPQSDSAYYNRGNCRVNLGQYDKAIKDYTKAIEINPQHALAYYNRGIAFMDRENFDDAIEDFVKAAQLDPTLTKKAQKKINECMMRK